MDSRMATLFFPGSIGFDCDADGPFCMDFRHQRITNWEGLLTQPIQHWTRDRVCSGRFPVRGCAVAAIHCYTYSATSLLLSVPAADDVAGSVHEAPRCEFASTAARGSGRTPHRGNGHSARPHCL